MKVNESFEDFPLWKLKLSDLEVKEIICKHLLKENYEVSSSDINIFPMTNSKYEFVVRQAKKIVP